MSYYAVFNVSVDICDWHTHLIETVLLSLEYSHICFGGEIRKIIFDYTL